MYDISHRNLFVCLPDQIGHSCHRLLNNGALCLASGVSHTHLQAKNLHVESETHIAHAKFALPEL